MTKAIEKSAVWCLYKQCVTLAFFAAMCACSSTPKNYSISGDGDHILNRDINGKSLSVVVRVYQLRDANEFSKLTFDTLAAGYPESELLGTSLLAKSDVILVPGGSYTSTEKLLDDTRFVGIVGLFRNPDPHHWRQLVDIKSLDGYRGSTLSFKAQDCYILVNGIKPLLLPGQPPTARGDCGTSNVSSISPSRPPQARNAQGERPAASTAYGQQRTPGTTQQAMPNVNVNMPSSVTPPTSVRVGGPGGSTITVGEPAQPTPPAYYPQPGYASPPAYYAPPGSYAPPR